METTKYWMIVGGKNGRIDAILPMKDNSEKEIEECSGGNWGMPYLFILRASSIEKVYKQLRMCRFIWVPIPRQRTVTFSYWNI